jgi:calcium/calmodulin-dependent protein kinase I
VAVGHKGEVIVQLFDGKKILVFPHSRADSDMWVDLLQRASGRKIGNFYGVTGLIGMGSFAEVRIGYDKASGDQVAIKVMKKNKRDTELMRSVECEMNFISKNIDHVNIVKTYDVFDTRDNLFIVMEYMPGGMLYDILANEGQFSEKNAAAIMRDLLEAVHCLHQYDIVHRDIKPENVLALNKTFPLQVKLADFGLADFVLENSFGEKSTCGMYGTPFFVAPEVIRAETYTPAVDIWSLGVLAYNMLSGKLPFDGSNIKEVLRRVRSGRYEFPDAEWAEISPEAMSFISGLLELDPHNRLTARQALNHSWINNDQLSERAIQNDRSALGYDQRKLRMSSMAIDDVAALLDMEDDDEDGDGDGNGGTSALARLFPSRTSNAKAPHSARSSAAQSPSNSFGFRHHKSTSHGSGSSPGSRTTPRRSSTVNLAPGAGRPPPRPKPVASQGSDPVSPAYAQLRQQQQSSPQLQQYQEQQLADQEQQEQMYYQQAPPVRNGDILPPLHPLLASGSIAPMSSDSLSPEDIDPFSNPYNYNPRQSNAASDQEYFQQQRLQQQQAVQLRQEQQQYQQHRIQQQQQRQHQYSGYEQRSGNQDDDVSGYQEDHVGGLEANPGFLLPAMISVKEMRKRKDAAAANGGKLPPLPAPVMRRNSDFGSEDSDDAMFSMKHS